MLMRRKFPPPWGYWSHCGLVCDPVKEEVIHAVSGSGVTLAKTEHFLCGDEVAVVRPLFLSDGEIGAVISEAKRHLGKPFTFFSMKKTSGGYGDHSNRHDEHDKLSCSTLLWQAVFGATGKKIPASAFVVPDDFCDPKYFNNIFWMKA